ncbi:MAG: phosphatase PAP2 family protein [Cyclobacteriaceae bacterium]|nr:phosphatase PAP2 family protein [Cyclobacteriaceae bacterium]
MNTIQTSLRLLIPCLFITVIIVSCQQEIEDGEIVKPLTPARLDEDAGTWSMIVLTSPDQVPVAAPASVTSDAYKAELEAIKKAQQSLSSAQQRTIDFWSGGGVLRWNQIMRELVARYNLPPAPNDQGTYPTPDPENPFADPKFPFSNPPYAARAYSYVSVAQYEGMKAAWHYKYLYNRPAPYTVDASIKALVPKTTLPAYPSEDAVLSGVTVELLKLLFPASVEEITKHAADQRNAALWSGKASSSDIAAGLALGKSIAAIIIARASTDGMRNAIGTPAQWEALYDSARVHWTKAGVNGGTEVLWKSLEIPPRPPMLPFFGQVKGWLMTPQDFAANRPGPPPSSVSEKMKEEIEEVKRYSINATRNQIAIVHKWADGVGTYTPPGHWNDIAAEYVRDANYSEVRAARAMALLNMALHNAGVACWENKYYWMNPRPSQLDPSIKTWTGLPNFPAYGSGHSTFSSSAAGVLSYLFPVHADYFIMQADEAAISRLYGAIHYRADIEDGMTHGERIASFVVNFAKQDGAD